MSKAYYNEFDPFAAAWLRELIKAGQIAPGDVDERSIEDILPSELRGYTQCHFFAGIGVWSYALRRVGWPDNRPVWTGSCPCQPFSAAGKRTGTADERHLWPAFYHLIGECKPPVVFGEQVASKDGLAWFDTVQADLEGAGYAATAIDLCSAGFGAPHIRQRLYFVASSTYGVGAWNPARERGRIISPAISGHTPVDYTADSRYNSARECDGRSSLLSTRSEQSSVAGIILGDAPTQRLPLRSGETVSGRQARGFDQRSSNAGRMAITDSTVPSEEREQRIRQQLQFSEDEGIGFGVAVSECGTGREERENAGRRGKGSRKEGLEQRPVHGCDGVELANNNNQGLERRELPAERTTECAVGTSRLVNGFWADAEWIYCRDEKFRPIEPSSSPLATGVANRVGKLRGYGNALTAEVAKAFIEAYLATEHN